MKGRHGEQGRRRQTRWRKRRRRRIEERKHRPQSAEQRRRTEWRAIEDKQKFISGSEPRIREREENTKRSHCVVYSAGAHKIWVKG